MSFETPLKERQRLSRVHRARYWSDSEYRLRKINRAREWQGLPPRQSVDEVGASVSRHERRDERGRFA